MSSQPESKEGEPIEVGDIVGTRYRGGKHEGEVAVFCFLPIPHLNCTQVKAVVTNQHQAREASQEFGLDVKNPPKVLLEDQVRMRPFIVRETTYRVICSTGTSSHTIPEPLHIQNDQNELQQHAV
jgi:hypothetical protein